MIKGIICSVLPFLIIISCKNNSDDDQTSSNKVLSSDQTSATLVETKEDLPTCEEILFGQLFYIQSENEFVVCSFNDDIYQFEKIDIKGPQGDKGDTGEKGDTGDKGETGEGSLIKIIDLESGDENCPYGGNKVISYMDTDMNEDLSEADVTLSVSYICEDKSPDELILEEALELLDFNMISGDNMDPMDISSDLQLPGIIGDDVLVSWRSNNKFVTDDGIVTRLFDAQKRDTGLEFGVELFPEDVKLFAIIVKGSELRSKVFDIKIRQRSALDFVGPSTFDDGAYYTTLYPDVTTGIITIVSTPPDLKNLPMKPNCNTLNVGFYYVFDNQLYFCSLDNQGNPTEYQLDSTIPGTFESIIVFDEAKDLITVGGIINQNGIETCHINGSTTLLTEEGCLLPTGRRWQGSGDDRVSVDGGSFKYDPGN